MRIVFWGTYDTGKPRVRIMLNGLRKNGVDTIECHSSVWGDIQDKSQIHGVMGKIRLLGRWISSYPGLIIRYLKLPEHDVVVVGYMGHLDVLVLWPFAKLRRVPIVWDAFLSLYNTVVEDRKLIRPSHPFALVLSAWEWIACRAASLVILDTLAHADYFVSRFMIDAESTSSVLVGVEPEIFQKNLIHVRPTSYSENSLTLLFYGQFIPLHGIETIIEAAQKVENDLVRWVIIGKGQEGSRIRELLSQHPVKNLSWVPWVPYGELADWISHADLCLGIFGDSDKASRVIPNKIFQILAMGKPLITRDSPAIRELLTPDMPGVYLIPPADSEALVRAVAKFESERESLKKIRLHNAVINKIQPASIGRQLVKLAKEVH